MTFEGVFFAGGSRRSPSAKCGLCGWIISDKTAANLCLIRFGELRYRWRFRLCGLNWFFKNDAMDIRWLCVVFIEWSGTVMFDLGTDVWRTRSSTSNDWEIDGTWPTGPQNYFPLVKYEKELHFFFKRVCSQPEVFIRMTEQSEFELHVSYWNFWCIYFLEAHLSTLVCVVQFVEQCLALSKTTPSFCVSKFKIQYWRVRANIFARLCLSPYSFFF